jgi:hypothetical protein
LKAGIASGWVSSPVNTSDSPVMMLIEPSVTMKG